MSILEKLPFFSKSKPVVETKTIGIPVGNYQQGSFLDFIVSGNFGISPRHAIGFYQKAAAVATAVDMIADEIEMISPVIQTPDGKLITDSPLLDRLRRPNGVETQGEFLGQLARNWLITHNAITFAAGNVNRPPVELWAVNPQEVTAQVMNSGDVYPKAYLVLNGIGRGNYQRVENSKGWRYYDGQIKELYLIRGFASRTNNAFGDSPLEAAALEARQQVLGRWHNLRLLENGGRLSLVAVFKDTMDQEQHDERRQSINEQLAGPENANKIAVISSEDLEIQDFGTNNRDMDYATLDQVAREAIFLRYKIPLPLVSMDASTFNNMEQAVFHLYDRAVLPNFQKIMNGLQKMLFPRYGIDEGHKLTFNPESISALQSRRLDELQKRKDIGIETDNELRQFLPNREPYEGGDVHYKPATFVPVGEDAFTDDNAQTEEELRRAVEQ